MKKLLFGLGLIALVGTGCTKEDDGTSSTSTDAIQRAHQEKIRQANALLLQNKFNKPPLLSPHNPLLELPRTTVFDRQDRSFEKKHNK